MRHWVFDLDGTLVDSFSRYFVALRDIFHEYGKEFSDSHRLPALTEPLPQFFEKNLGEKSVLLALSKLQMRSNDDAKHIAPFDGIPSLIQELKKQNARIGVWTNRDLTSAQIILDQTGLGKLADAFVSGNCVIQRKPHPEGLLKIIEQFGCPPEQVTMVGDHEHDVSAAKAVGARAVRASWHTYWPIEKCSQADFQFFSVKDFCSWAQG